MSVTESQPDLLKDCIACPVEVRGLFASAANAVTAFEAAMNGHGESARAVRKMAELKAAVARFQPFVDAHFANRAHWNREEKTGA